ncbi:hypothetical protein Cni_G17796 [Canna indica]|uniref:Uncharacterized protein n=1 Tax=Canna indica TaxID=4628 RepID=A0AAQ3QH42_9LILI|nr:hypothetical protein Cni_G17796 [Canna indica]
MEGNNNTKPHQSSSSSSPLPPAARGPSLYDRLRSFLFARPLVFFVLLYLTANVAIAAYRSRGDWPTLSFVLFSYVDLLLLFFFLSRFEQLGGGARGSREKRARLKGGVWALSAALMIGFSWRVGEVFSWPMKVVIWTMTASVAGGGFYALFLHDD